MDYSPELADVICDRLIEGESMRRICEDESMPSRSTLLRWMHDIPEFEAKCARARLMQADTMDDLVLQIAQNVDEGNCQSSKVKLAAYQWRASKLAPKRYGDKLDMNLAGKDGGPIQASIAVTFVKTGNAADQS